jgi:GTP cyclohydrolase II
MRAYVLQDAGLDTVEANHWLGFEDDQRDFRIGASILRQMGIERVRLMTNNPAKVRILSDHGIDVLERVVLEVGRNEHNAHYLATKARKSGHLL